MEQLKMMKEQLTSMIQSQMGDIRHTDTKELGEAIDMVKDLSEAIYYCTIVKSMEESDEGKTKEYPYNAERSRYYGDGAIVNGAEHTTHTMYYGNRRNPVYYGEQYPVYYRENEMRYQDMMSRDPREGRSPRSRRMYMESQEMHQDTSTKMKELENYVKELSNDITEMIEKASPEEKVLLRQKISALSDKIV